MIAIEVTLDDTYQPGYLDQRITAESKILSEIRGTIARRAFCMALGEFLRDVKRATPDGNGRRSNIYVVTEDDIRACALMLTDGLKGLTK